MQGPDLPPQAVLMKMVMGSWVSQAIGAAARLSLADHVAAGATTAAELATRANANPDAVFRLMRALATLGVFTMSGDRFGLTPIGQTLCSGPGSMKNIAIAETDTAHWLPWGQFTDAIRTGKSVARTALGCDPWDYYAEHPEDGHQFSLAMADISGLAIGPVLSMYDASFASTIADIGGAHGALLLALLGKYTAARGVLFDLPHVAATAKVAVEAAGMSSRVDVVGGDFFADVPTADLYLLKHIIHDWDDDRCVNILSSIRRAMKPSSRILIVEFALPPEPVPTPGFLMDLNMLVMLDGRERTPEQYGALVARAGLKMSRFIPTPSPLGLVEVIPA